MLREPRRVNIHQTPSLVNDSLLLLHLHHAIVIIARDEKT